MIREKILDYIGGTPIVPLRKVVGKESAEVLAKLEGFNPGGSVKDRIALAMIESAERSGDLKPGGTIVEPTSGNTGIGLAMVARIKGYRMILTMPDTMTVERRQLLEAYGAELVLTEGAKGMGGAVQRASDLMQENPDWYLPQQFKNPANPEVHRRTTAREILGAVTGPIHAFVAGVGTGGTITGVGEVLREKYPSIRIVAVEPAGSPVLQTGKAGPHKIAGIGAGFVPEVLNTKIYDEVMAVEDNAAAEMTRCLALEEGLLLGISSGAAAWAALEIAKKLGKGKRVVVIFPDRGDRYLSAGLFKRN